MRLNFYLALVTLAGALLLTVSRGQAAEQSRFDGPGDLTKWQTKGAMSLDANRHHGDAGSSLRIDPGCSALWPLREKNDSGRVSLWVFDDATAIANPKKQHVGPRWGIVQSNGRVLVIGVMYAPYLSGDTSYAVSDSDQKMWFDVQYLGDKREAKWRNWIFNFDAQKGLTLWVDGQPIKRFDWNKTQATGFCGVVLLGDSVDSDKPQTLWVDDVQVELAGPMQVKPIPPPPPPPVVPEKDPVLEGPPVILRQEVRDQHPRLLINAQRLPQIKAFYNSQEGRVWREKLLAFLPTCKVPDKVGFLQDATDGQRQGLWRIPTVALHYMLTGDKTSFERTVAYMKWLLAQPYWETSMELDSGMSSANIMIGASLAFDWLYADLEPEFREQFRRKLIHHARAQYYGGHLEKNPGVHYWQQDPQNNHRWHRDAGLALAVLATNSGAADEQWILARTHEELDYIIKWLPQDGTSHESATYMVFGGPHLLMAAQASDECLGTHYLDAGFFKNVTMFRLQMLTPGMTDSIHYGDSSGLGSYNNFMFKCAAYHKQAQAMDGIRQLGQASQESMWCVWWSLLWDDPKLTGGQYTQLPTNTFWPDLGLAIVRENWQNNAVAAMFKCGPPGGYLLNEFRNENQFKYINVAHDDPDANSFTIFANGQFVAETDRYSAAKRSSNFNTILVNGIGQLPQGCEEPASFFQPATTGDMTQMARITAWKNAGDVVVVEGEAAGSYLAYANNKTKQNRPALDRYRRTFVWVRGDYVLVFDDIRAPQPVNITWLMQGAKLEPVAASQGHYRLSKKNATCDFQVLSDSPFHAEIVPSTADDHGKPLGWQQLQLGADTQAIRFVSLYDPWQKKNLKFTLATADRDHATITITGPNISDTWQMQAATGKFEASTIRGSRTNGFAVDINATNSAPPTEALAK